MSKILCVLDGFGLLPKSPNNAAALAKMPNLKYLLKNYFWTTLNADGEQVGQEDGLVGNSEVGHMNIGGLKLVPQLSYQITKSSDKAYNLNKEIAPDQFFDPKKFLSKKFEGENKTIHLIGLFSTGTIHSDLRHWAGSIEAAGKAGAEKIVMHLISDGRDSDRQSLVATWDYFIKEYESKIKPFENKIFLGSLGGRFYSMDRDNNWDRVARGILPMFNYRAFKYLENDADFVELQKDNTSKRGIAHTEATLPDNLDVGDFKLLKKFILSKYNVDLDSVIELDKHKYEKDNVDFEPTEENFQKYHNFHVDYAQHFLYLNADKQEREKYGPLKADIRWILQYYTEKCYRKEMYDEFILPCNWYYLPLNAEARPFDQISKNDTVWLLNFRTDRMKEFAQVLTDINEEFELNLTVLANNSYGIKKEEFLNENLEVSEVHLPGHFGEETYKAPAYFPIFRNKPVENTLAQYISKNGKTQLHIAETEKYNHVTYFMNGGQNKKWEREDWQVIDSNKVASHAEKPEMKAKEVTDYILDNGLGKYDYILVNYANPDMVGHTGDIKASITTMEFLDQQLGRLIQACEKDGHEMVITADHGNIEKVGEYDLGGKSLIDTEHNANSVPLIILSSKFKVHSAEIGDVSFRVNREILTESDKISPGGRNDSGLFNNVQKLIENKIVNLDLEQFKNVLSQKNHVDLDTDSWLLEEQIPQPVLPLWYVGLILIGL